MSMTLALTAWVGIGIAVGMSRHAAAAQQVPTDVQAERPPAQSPGCQSAADQFDAVWRATYGKSAPLQTLVRKGTCVFHIHRMDGSEVHEGRFEETYAAGGKARVFADFKDFGRFEEGSNGVKVWEIDPITGPFVRAPEAAVDHVRMYRRMTGPPWRDLYASIEVKGVRRLGERDGLEFIAVPHKGNPESWIVDPETSLPFLWRSRVINANGLEQNVRLTFDDWRDVGGSMQPFSQCWTMGQVSVDYTVESAVVNGEVAAKLFELPGPVARDTGTHVRVVLRNLNIVQVEEQSTMGIRGKIVLGDVDRETASILIGRSLAVMWSEVKKHLEKHGVKTDNLKPYSRFWHRGSDYVDVEAGFPAPINVPGEGRVKPSKLPATSAVLWIHWGAYDRLPYTYQRIEKLLAERKLKSKTGEVPWEVYLTDPVVEHDKKKWRTEIRVPIGKDKR